MTPSQLEKYAQRKLWTFVDLVFHEAVREYGKLYGVRVKIDQHYPKKNASKEELIRFAKVMQLLMPQ